MDACSVSNIVAIGIPVVKSSRLTTALPLDVHLMDVAGAYVEQFCDAGADLVTVHVESDTPENIHAAIDKRSTCHGKKAASSSPKTLPSGPCRTLEKVDLILVMTVKSGFGGQKFAADMMPKVPPSAPGSTRTRPASWR